MAHLIDKDAVLAEINKRVGFNKALNAYSRADECNAILSLIDSLEVKEVDYNPIDKDFERDAVQFCFDNALNTTPRIARTIAKHFFELGLRAHKGEEV